MEFRGRNFCALILGGSSGFGLASAQELARRGMDICIVHRDRRGSMSRIEGEFELIRQTGVKFCSFNLDALSSAGRTEVLNELPKFLGESRIRLFLHSIAFGSLKLIAPRLPRPDLTVNSLAEHLGRSVDQVQNSIDTLFAAGICALHSVATAPAYDSEMLLEEEDMLSTLYAMGMSYLTWTRELFMRALFCPDARAIGLTSEGNTVAWLGYAAVSAAKASLEAISRSIAKEFGPHGIRSNIVQPGITDTPALRVIPGNRHLMARAELRNPLGRLTQVEDVARVVAFLAHDDAAWINGSVIRVDGGENISG
ncbi:MAG: SDR family oxidoreductase [Deltaproteobacteria bacterium]|nr:SDR family oxidoreductase [Deltaproteobacteria bacterium]